MNKKARIVLNLITKKYIILSFIVCCIILLAVFIIAAAPAITFISPTPSNNTFSNSNSTIINISSDIDLKSCYIEVVSNTTLQENLTVLNDAYVSTQFDWEEYNFGKQSYFYAGDGYWSFLMFNTSSPRNKVLNTAILYLNHASGCYASEQWLNVSVYHVYNNSWAEGSGTDSGKINVTGQSSDTNISYNNNPCGTSFNDAAQCNLTAESTQYINDTCGAPDGNYTFNVMESLQGMGNNVSFLISDNYNFKRYNSKEVGGNNKIATTYTNYSVNMTISDSSRNAWVNLTNLINMYSYDYRVVCNSTLDEENSTAWYKLIVDSIFTRVNITYPKNTTYTSNVSILNYTVIDTNLQACWYSTNLGDANYSITCGSNITGLNATPGSNTWTVWANDSGGYVNSSSVTFWKYITPAISIKYPANTSYYNISVLNYSVINGAFCWWGNSTWNSSIVTAGTNFTILESYFSQGSNNWTVWCNDTYNNLNSTSVVFHLDRLGPGINIAHPQAKTYTTNTNHSANYTVSDSVTTIDSCRYEVLHSTGYVHIDNTTLTNCGNTTFSTSQDGTWSLFIYSNDSYGNINYTKVTFATSTAAPAVNLDYPSDSSWFGSVLNMYFNFTASDSDGINTCQLWGNWTNAWHKNQSWYGITSDEQNYTAKNLTEGKFIWSIWCNDTGDAKSWALNNRTVGVDLSYPQISIPFLSTTTNSQTFSFNTTITDLSLDSCKYSIYNSTGGIDGLNNNVSFTCNQVTSATVTQYGTFSLKVYAIDQLDNENSSTTSVTVTASGGGGAGGGGSLLEKIVEVPSNRTYIGDGICQNPQNGFTNGNDDGVIEDFYNAPNDCPGFNIDSTIFNCFDKDPTTLCIWDQGLAKYVGLFMGIIIALLMFTTVEEKGTKKHVPIYRYTLNKIKKRK